MWKSFPAETTDFSGLDKFSLQYVLVEVLPSEFYMNIAL